MLAVIQRQSRQCFFDFCISIQHTRFFIVCFFSAAPASRVFVKLLIVAVLFIADIFLEYKVH